MPGSRTSHSPQAHALREVKIRASCDAEAAEPASWVGACGDRRHGPKILLWPRHRATTATEPIDRQPVHCYARSVRAGPWPTAIASRSEEHTSELQSLMRISYAVFCLKKKTAHT